MKKYLGILLSLTLVFTASVCLAADGDKYNDGTIRVTADGIAPVSSSTDCGSASVPFDVVYANTITKTVPTVGIVSLPVTTLTSNGADVTASTAPGIETDNLLSAVVWADGETTPCQVTFKVPDDYLSGGAFKGLFDSSNSATPAKVDYAVYVNKHNTAWDSAATDQAAVALTTAASTPCVVALPIATDFASLAAGDMVTLTVWRDDVSDGTGDLEAYYLEFYYNKQQ
jgi:hypothetical protein